MEGMFLVLFCFAAFAGGFVSGFSGFAMGLVVSGVWLHMITPVQTATLIAGYGLLTQGYGILKLRQKLNWRAIWPLSLGTTIGIPIGVLLLTYINPIYMRLGVGLLLVLYAIYSLARPAFKPMKIGAAPDIGIGFVNGLVGGLTGLGGVVSTISCQWRGWTRDAQRAVFQPVLFAAFVVISFSLAVTGAFTTETVKLYALGLPFLLVGLWSGFRLYGKIDDEMFRKVVLLLILLAGLSLIVPAVLEDAVSLRTGKAGAATVSSLHCNSIET